MREEHLVEYQRKALQTQYEDVWEIYKNTPMAGLTCPLNDCMFQHFINPMHSPAMQCQSV